MQRRDFLRTAAGALAGAAAIPREAGAAPGAKPPNILFCVADDASYPHMGAYGCSWVKTPAFDRVARDGLLFTNAYTPNAKCAPSRASILTGRNSWQLEAAANHWCFFPAKLRTYVEALEANGYFTGFTGKGWAPGVAGKGRQLTGRPFQKRQAKPPASGISPRDYAANFRDFLDARPEGKPFCFWYGGHEPHRGYEFRSGITKGGKTVSEVDRVFGFWPDNETVRTDILDYAFEIEHFDRHAARMLAMLEEHGELANTLVVMTADNGMPFPRIKGQEYEYSNHLPLAVMWSQGIRRPGRRIDAYVSFIDFAPTFLDIAGVTEAASGMQPITGCSFTDLFADEAAHRAPPARDRVLIGKERHDIGRPHDWGYPIRGIVKGGYLYIHNFETDRWPAGHPRTGYLNCDGSPTKTVCLDARAKDATAKYWQLSFGKRPSEELYNIRHDPECLVNLANDAALGPRKQALKEQLFSELKQQGDPRMFGNGHIFDEYPYADAKSRHFYERFMAGEKLRAGWVNNSDFETDFP